MPCGYCGNFPTHVGVLALRHDNTWTGRVIYVTCYSFMLLLYPVCNCQHNFTNLVRDDTLKLKWKIFHPTVSRAGVSFKWRVRLGCAAGCPFSWAQSNIPFSQFWWFMQAVFRRGGIEFMLLTEQWEWVDHGLDISRVMLVVSLVGYM